MTEEDTALVVECAAMAPSVHNTQPWQFTVAGDTVEVHLDPERRLAFLDPSGRQLHVSCGAAIEFGYLAARSAGRAASVEVLPSGGSPDLVARITLGAPDEATDQERALAAAMAVRYTDRGPYLDRPLPAGLLDDVERRATELDAWVRLLEDRDQRSTLIAVLSDAESAEAADPRYAEELAAWTSAEAGPEGVPRDAAGGDWPADRVSDVPLRDFSGQDRHPRPADTPEGAPPTVERDTLLMLGTPADDRASWLAAGRALGWTLLRAAADGVSAQPLGQAIDLASGRARLRSELGIVGHPQFLMRMGYGSGRPWARRRQPVTTE